MGHGIIIVPFDERLLGPASLDIRLGSTVRRVKPSRAPALLELTGDLDMDEWTDAEQLSRAEGGRVFQGSYWLRLGDLVIGYTLEHITLGENICARLTGCNRFAQTGLGIEVSSDFVEPGTSGHLKFELHNVGPLALNLTPGLAIAQLVFERCE